MTRFQRELSGELGTFWQKEAKKELARVKDDLDAGRITIDENGVARNCIGRVLMSDLLEKLAMVTDKVDPDATQAAEDAESAAFLAEYRKHPHPVDKAELRAAFGEGTTVVDILSGETYTT